MRKAEKVADESGALFVLAHNYTGYPMVRQAREMIANGELGALRVVQVEYAQDWLTEAVEATGAKGLSGVPIRPSPALAARRATSVPMPSISHPS